MEQLTQKQNDIGTAIITLLDNLRKTPRDRRTGAYVERKQTDLNALWSDFQLRHNEILKLNQPEHKYFTQMYPQQVEKTVKEVTAVLTAFTEAMNTPYQPSGTSTLESSIENKKQNESSQVIYKRFTLRLEAFANQLTQMKVNSPQNAGIIEFYIKSLTANWEKAEKLCEELLIHSEESDKQTNEFKAVITQYNELEMEYNKTIIELQEKKFELRSPSEYDIRLPCLTIPTFDGSYDSWRAFHDIYTKVIHNNHRLANVEKLQYLKSNLKGEAAKLLNHLEISDANYAVAWELIKHRFENKRKLISAHLQTLLALPKLENESINGLKRMHDTMKECLHGINNLDVDTSTWDPIVIHLMIQKLDLETLKLYEQSLICPKAIPSFSVFYNFLETRFQSLETIRENRKRETSIIKAPILKHASPYRGKPQIIRNFVLKNAQACKYCHNEHSIYNCSEFQALTTQERHNFINKNKLCRNCLNHSELEKCKSKYKCNICQRPHHSLLHEDESQSHRKYSTARSNQVKHSGENVKIQNHLSQQHSTVLLATALIKTRTIRGTYETLRVLIDPGSQASYVTENIAQLLALPRTRVYAEISGIATSKAGIARSKIKMEVQPRFTSNFKCQIEALVLPKLTSFLPDKLSSISLPDVNKILADPNFNRPAPVDVIIGADNFGTIILNGVEKTSNGLVMQNTELGWIVSGQTHTYKTPTKIVSMISNVDIDNQLKRFWEQEEIPSVYQASSSDQECEAHYKATHRRNKDGTYTVKIPFKETPDDLGSTRKLAVSRLLQIEKRFQKDPNFQKEYTGFMKEYIKLGHMILADPPTTHKVCYLPHHAVTKAESTSTKLRVVFDASTKTYAGKSLNTKMHIGPQLQQDLATILLRWRKHQYALTADIEKMYRQVKIADDDQEFQRILWRNTPNEAIKEYRLTTVTYGTAAAPYLAIRTMQQLATDEKNKHPIAAKIIQRDFYVDDMLTGADTKEEAMKMQKDITKVLASGGFNLRKWASNNPELLQAISNSSRAEDFMEIADRNTVKTLGIHWSPKNDSFHFKVNLASCSEFTKRQLLSDAAKIFDPLGWLTPVTVKAKLLLQKLWIAGITWDEPIPEDLQAEWSTFRKELSTLEKVQIPRWICQKSTMQQIELHGFSDASEKAYAAAIYSKVITASGRTVIRLLTAKSKIAPINSKMTIPRLELCGILLLAKLMQHTIRAMELNNPSIFLWSDSMVALAWIKGDPIRWKSFIAHRVTEIQAITNPCQWNYIKSEENPADCASRGINPSQIINHPNWWTGPSWLQHQTETLPKITIQGNCTVEQETKQKYKTLTTMKNEDFIERFSTMRKLIRIVAYCNRFINNVNKQKKEKYKGELDATELERATHIVIRLAQSLEFKEEIKALSIKKQLNPKSKLLSLNPFIDENHILRVGGRLKNANISFDEKYPIILPQKSHFTTLVINEAHEKTLHGGNQSTLAHIRRKFWIINPRDSIRQQLHKCIKCFRAKSRSTQQIMGNLPSPRVTPSRPFTHTGVDYAGPIQIKLSNGRGYKSSKGYIAAFICLATKAIHIEAVTDLTSAAFLAAFKRFTARRGLCSHIYSDCGTNFIGAQKILSNEFHTAITQNTPQIAALLANDGIQWHFNPPAAPQMGGLWEAGIKSIKHHLRRVIGETTLTFEELATVLQQIEACLNSRPLCPLSNDPEDLNALTPGHFLIGAAPLSPPTNPANEDKLAYSTRWKLVNKLQRDFWKVWSSEYLSRLQQRPKWQRREENLKPGELVLIKEENVPPTKWLLARVVKIHPGDDGLVRVVSLKCKENTILKRPITKVCKLPQEDNQENTELQQELQIASNISVNKVMVFSDLTYNNIMSEKGTSVSGKRKYEIENDNNEIKRKKSCSNSCFDQLVKEFRQIHTQRKRKHTRIHPVTTYSTLVSIEKQIAAAEAYRKRFKVDIPTPIQHHKPKRNYTRHNQLGTILHPTILCILLLFLAKLGRCSYNITHPKPGLYIEDIGEANLKRGTLRIELKYALNTTADEEQINNTISQMEDVCKKTRDLSSEIHCDLLIQHLKQKGETVLNEISSLTYEEHSRSKRGILGKVLEAVFGVNEEAYTDISILQQNEASLQQAIQHQSSIMLSTITTVNETEARVVQKVNMFTMKLNKALEEINKVQGWFSNIDANRININVLAAYQIAINLFDELEAHYVKIMKLILKKGNLLEFISPAKLANIITETSKKIPFNLKISSIPEERLEWHKDGNNFTVYGFLSITEPDKYSLFKITPIPERVGNNTYIAPDINKEILATNYNTQNYFELTEAELTTCTSQGKHLVLCTPPVVSNMETNPNCVIDEIYQRHGGQHCPSREFSIQTIVWKPLYMTNTWLYITNTPTNAAIKCNGIREDVLLNQTGIIQITNNCFIQTKQNILKSFLATQVPVKGTFTKPLNFDQMTARKINSEHIESEAVLKPTDHLFDATKDHIQQDLNAGPTILKTIGHHTASATSAVITTILILIIILKLKPRIRHHWLNRQANTADKANKQGAPEPPRRTNISTKDTSSNHDFILELPARDNRCDSSHGGGECSDSVYAIIAKNGPEKNL